MGVVEDRRRGMVCFFYKMKVVIQWIKDRICGVKWRCRGTGVVRG